MIVPRWGLLLASASNQHWRHTFLSQVLLESVTMTIYMKEG